MRFKQFIGLGFIVFAWGCTKTIDLALPDYIKEPVVTALLNPDSLIRVQLSYSFPANSVQTIPEPIQKARVTLSEDGNLLPPLTEGKAGQYALNRKPQPGSVYSLTVLTPIGKTLLATDRIPVRPTLSAQLSDPNPANSNSNPDILLTLRPYENTSSVQWLSVYMRVLTGPQNLPETNTQGIQSNSLLFDDFNSNLSGKNYKRTYWPYTRIKPTVFESLENPILTFNTGNSIQRVDTPGEFYQLTIWTGSNAFDNYLRSVVIAYQNRISDDGDISENPFVQPSPIVSNVTNGKGVFAGYTTQVILLKEGKK
ncbi:MAG: DUF4249 domain-containing protein [Cytophagales bacterium]|nr:MAG: DUF4249 domain-containing protein [Cytophagales bacterium]